MASFLQQIGLGYGTDKSRNAHKGITFLEKYEKYFSGRIGEKLNILEMGVLNGGSVKTWKDYFLFSNIIGIDIDPRCKQFESDRLEIFIGSQDSIEIRDKIKNKYNSLDIILDDGAHINELMFNSFDLYWPLLNNNGIYIIEDYSLGWGDMTEHAKNWPGMSYNDPKVELNNTKISLDEFILRNIKELYNENGSIYDIHFSHGSIIFTKKV